MLTLYDQRSSGESSLQNDGVGSSRDDIGETIVRDIHALTPEHRSHALPPPPIQRGYFSPARSASLSDAASSGGENFTTISREFNALVIAGSSMDHHHHNNNSNNDYNNNNINNNNNNYQENNYNQVGREGRHDLRRIGEDEVPEEETNRLAIVPDGIVPMGLGSGSGSGSDWGTLGQVGMGSTTSVQTVRREEVDTKITAWQNAKVAKINNRFKREDAIISGCENEQVHKATSLMKKVERKLEEKRARAMEKMQNNVAKARRKAEERRATAEGKRGTEVARVLEVANLMRAVGRPPAKRSFFSFK